MYYSEIEKFLEVYSLEDILEFNDLTEVEVLDYLIQQKFVSLPSPRPL